MPDAIRWTIRVSKETDLSLRTFLGSQEKEKGVFYKFVEEAVQWQLLARTAKVLKERRRIQADEALQAVLDDEVRAVRTVAARDP